MPKSQNFGVREASQGHPLLCNNLSKRMSVVINKHASAEELLEPVFSTQSLTGLYKESGFRPHGTHDHTVQTKKYGHGPQNQNNCAGDSQQLFT
jgi:hypothetical protein